jgi:hypothetical protein
LTAQDWLGPIIAEPLPSARLRKVRVLCELARLAPASVVAEGPRLTTASSGDRLSDRQLLLNEATAMVQWFVP